VHTTHSGFWIRPGGKILTPGDKAELTL